MGSEAFNVVEESELVAFFGGEPVEVGEGYLRFDVSDVHEVGLSLSYDRFERSIQTKVTVSGVCVATVSHEGAQFLGLGGELLRGICEYGGMQTKLSVRLRPRIEVEWSSLVIR